MDAHLVAGKPLEPKSTNLRWRNLVGALAITKGIVDVRRWNNIPAETLIEG